MSFGTHVYYSPTIHTDTLLHCKCSNKSINEDVTVLSIFPISRSLSPWWNIDVLASLLNDHLIESSHFLTLPEESQTIRKKIGTHRKKTPRMCLIRHHIILASYQNSSRLCNFLQIIKSNLNEKKTNVNVKFHLFFYFRFWLSVEIFHCKFFHYQCFEEKIS